MGKAEGREVKDREADVLHDFIWFLNVGRFDSAWVQAVTSAVLVIISVITLIVLCIYAWDTHSLAESSKLSAEAAVTGSKAALAQIQATIEKERARLFVVPYTVGSFIVIFRGAGTFDDASHPFTFLNVGPTPAINLSVRYRAALTESETDAVGELLSRAVISDVIAANRDANASLRIESGLGGRTPLGCYLHVWGEAIYNDVISSDQRVTRFRYRLPMQFFQRWRRAERRMGKVRFGERQYGHIEP